MIIFLASVEEIITLLTEIHIKSDVIVTLLISTEKIIILLT
jgi:hypothetical protein